MVLAAKKIRNFEIFSEFNREIGLWTEMPASVDCAEGTATFWKL